MAVRERRAASAQARAKLLNSCSCLGIGDDPLAGASPGVEDRGVIAPTESTADGGEALVG